MKKRVLAILISALLVFTLTPIFAGAATSIPSLTDKSIYYISEYPDNGCQICAHRNMIMRKMIILRSLKWDEVTVDSLNPAKKNLEGYKGNGNGKSLSVTYDGVTFNVVRTTLSGKTPEEKKAILIEELNAHPEGFMIYGATGSNGTGHTHGVLLVGYDSAKDKFRVIDATYNRPNQSTGKVVNKGITDFGGGSLKKIDYINFYQYIKSTSGKVKTPLYINIETKGTPTYKYVNTVYSGLAKEPTVTFGSLVEGTDYEVSYKDNVEPGYGSIIVTGIGRYEGTITKTLKIMPQEVDITKTTALYNSFTCNWEKDQYTDGYQIRYSKKKGMTSKKTKTFTGEGMTSARVKNLKTGTKYYYQVRSFMKASNGDTIYSPWNSRKSIQIKKKK